MSILTKAKELEDYKRSRQETKQAKNAGRSEGMMKMDMAMRNQKMQNAMYMVGGFAALWLGKKAYDRITDPSNDVVKGAGDNVQNSDLTFDSNKYKEFAEQIYTYLTKLDDNEEAIYDILKRLRTPSDWYRLVSVYGVKKGPRHGNSLSFIWSFEGNLNEWLSLELTNFEIRKIRQILIDIGVNY